MAKEKSIFKRYIEANTSKKVDIIMEHFSDFMGIIDGYTDGIRYRIQTEKDIKRRSEMGELGVRVQGGKIKSDPTANKAIDNIVTREAIINCDFSGDILEGLDAAAQYINDAYVLRQMHMDYDLFKNQLGILGKDTMVFIQYLNGEVNLMEAATRWENSYESAQQKVHKYRKRVKDQVVEFMSGELEGIA